MIRHSLSLRLPIQLPQAKHLGSVSSRYSAASWERDRALNRRVMQRLQTVRRGLASIAPLDTQPRLVVTLSSDRPACETVAPASWPLPYRFRYDQCGQTSRYGERPLAASHDSCHDTSAPPATEGQARVLGGVRHEECLVPERCSS